MTYDLQIIRETPGHITARAQVHGITRSQLTAEIEHSLRTAGPITRIEVRKGTGPHDLLYAGSPNGLSGKRLI